ncbi:MAG TPA: UPF0175 family protein [Pirellulales bacterium]|jgi:predicted HTH domain antitoxin|nr:UPF0175 family protein [Pirellulales bacterium]
MSVTIEIPKHIEEALVRDLGPSLADTAREALAIGLYQSERLSLGQVAEMLGIAVYEAASLMKSRGVEVPYSIDEFDRDQESLERMLGQ